MKEKITFTEIWKNDIRLRLLAGGMLADGILLCCIAVLTAIVIL